MRSLPLYPPATIEELLTELRAREDSYSLASQDEISACSSPLTVDRRQHVDKLRDIPSVVLYQTLVQLQISWYGIDDRRDVFAALATPPIPQEAAMTAPIAREVMQAADAVAALFIESHVVENGDGTVTLQTLPLGVRRGLCPEEPFANQPAGAFGTGFLVSPTLMMTAAHCADRCVQSDIRFVFGFRMISPQRPEVVLDVKNVFGAARIAASVQQESGQDWALFELDRPALGRRPLPVRRRGKIRQGTSVYTLGHPCGLPLKYADNAVVRENDKDSHFVANLDTYAGSSGSPVLGPDHVVEGMVVRGERDFVRVGNCYRSLVCPDNGGRGQDCIRATVFADAIPKHSQVGAR